MQEVFILKTSNKSSQAAFTFLRPGYFGIESRQVIVDGALRFRWRFLSRILLELPSADARPELNEIFHIQGHPYTLAALVRAERSLGRCSRRKPNNLPTDQSIVKRGASNSGRTQHSRHRSEARINFLLVGAFDL